MGNFNFNFKGSCSEISGLTGDTNESADDKILLSVTEWTNEKHSLYLKSMEASFVNQLHNSMDLLGWSSFRDQNPLDDTDSSSGQFKVLQSGRCWQRVNFKKCKAQSNNADEPRPRALLANPWIRHFRSSTIQENVVPTCQNFQLNESNELSNSLGTKSKHFPSWHSRLRGHDSDGSTEEESAQNFVEENAKRGEAGSTSGAKRKKTLVTNRSSDDQAVPVGNYPERQ